MQTPEEIAKERWLPEGMTPAMLRVIANGLEPDDYKLEIEALLRWASEIEARQKGGE